MPDIIARGMIENITTQKTTICTNSAVETEIIKDINWAQKVVLSITQMEDGMVEVFGKETNGTYTLLNMVSEFGNNQLQACEKGLYIVDKSGYYTIKAKYSPSYAGMRYCTASLILTLKPDTLVRKAVSSVTPVATVTSNINSYETPFTIKNNIVYGKRDYLLRKSTNFGTSWTTVKDFVNVLPIAALVADNGKITCILANGEVHTSDTNGANFAKTLTMVGGATGSFGNSIYANTILLCEYNLTKTPPTAKRVYMSQDGGTTWSTILDIIDSPNNFHTHDVMYDPWESIIWLTVGDGPASKNIYYSMDTGVTWHKVADYGNTPLQATAIIPMRDCVLFLGDSFQTGVLRYNRPSGGTKAGQVFGFDRALFIANTRLDGTKEVPIGGKAVIDYTNNRAYFGWYITPSAQLGGLELLNGEIYATDDGYKITKIFNTAVPCVGVGINIGLGIDSTGKILFALSDLNNGTTYPLNTLRLEVTW